MEQKKKFSFKNLMKVNELGAVIPLVLIFIVATIINPSFMSKANLMDILKTTSYTVILGVPLTLLLASGRMDLSIGATTALGGIIAAVAQTSGIPLPIALLLGVAVGLLVGFANSVLVEWLSLPGFIATLAMSNIVDGTSSVITNNQPVSGISAGFKAIAQTRLNGSLTITVVYAIIVAVLGHVLLKYTKYGRKILAVGGNAEAANLSGINTKKFHMHMYMLAGAFAAVSGILYCSRFSSAQLTAGSGTSLTILSSAIIGGTSMRGGNGTVIGTVLGCLLFTVITNALIVMGVSTNWQNVVYGCILVAALLIDYMRQKSARRA